MARYDPLGLVDLHRKDVDAGPGGMVLENLSNGPWVELVSVLVGAGLGRCFKLYILAPMTFLAWAFIVGNGILRGDSPLSIFVAMVVVAALMQVGYVGGLALRRVQPNKPRGGAARK
jgi:hypothetical protein